MSWEKSKGVTVDFVLILLFFFNSIGLAYPRTISFWLISLLLLGLLYKKLGTVKMIDLKKSRLIIGLILLVLVFSLLSLFQSINTNLALRVFIFYLSYIGIGIVGALYKSRLEVLLPRLLIVLGVIFCIYSTFIAIFKIPFLAVFDGYQLVFSKFGSHNHLGDFLVLPLLICLYLVVKEGKLKYLLAFSFFIPFFLLSYSRSAYLSLLVVGTVFLVNGLGRFKHLNRLLIPLVGLVALFSLVLVFFFSTVFESKFIPALNPIHQILAENFNLKFKHFGANRPEYFNTAIKSIQERPLLGVGPGNFIYASKEYSSVPNHSTHSSHNIFLDVLSENGVLAFVGFLGIILVIIKKTLKLFSVYSLLFYALLINFQTDYTFRIVSMALLFFLFIGMIWASEADKRT